MTIRLIKNLAALFAFVLALAATAHAAVVIEPTITEGDPTVRGTSFKVTLDVTGNAVTSATITNVAFNTAVTGPTARLTTFTTAEPHGLLPGDKVTVALDPATPAFDGDYNVSQVASPTQFLVYRFYNPNPTVPSLSLTTPSLVTHSPFPALAGLQVSFEPNTALTLVSATVDGGMGPLVQGTVQTSGTLSTLNLTTSGNTNASDLNPSVLELEFFLNFEAPIGTPYSISYADLPNPGALSLAKAAVQNLNLGGGTVVEIPDFTTIPHTWNSAPTTGLATTSSETSATDWMLLED